MNCGIERFTKSLNCSVMKDEIECTILMDTLKENNNNNEL